MKNVFLTGASTGIGRAIAGCLVKNGYRVWGTSRDIGRLPVHENFSPVALNLVDNASIRPAVMAAEELAGGFDVVINNAGAGIFSPLEQLADEQLRFQFQLLVFGPMEVIRLLLPGMRSRGGGIVVNITSLASIFPIPYMGAYSACKAALSSFTWTLEMELCQEPIRVAEIRPGDIRTDFHKRMEHHELLCEANSTENIARAYRVYTKNMNRAPSPEHVATRLLDLLNSDKKIQSQIDVGSIFQARIAPFLSRVVPRSWTRLALKKYFGLTCRS